MALFLQQDMVAIGQLTQTHLKSIYDSKTFKAWKDARDQSMKLPGIVVGRIDTVSKQIAGLAKVLASPRG